MKTIKIATIVGARPQFIKAAMVSHAIRNREGVGEVLIHTGQHYDSNMSKVFFEELDIPEPDYNLGIGGGTHGQNTGRMIEAIETVLMQERPDWVLVFGDTDSTLAGALAAVKLRIPLAHVEAGLRSFNRAMPEEINRILTDHASELLFCPTRTSVKNLSAEGITKGVIHAGDVMYDATLYAIDLIKKRGNIHGNHVAIGTGFALVTIHRNENTKDPSRLIEILDFVRKDATGMSSLFLPLHPRTRQAINNSGISLQGFCVIEPVGYLQMVDLLSKCAVVYTDSGGLQKEAYFHRKPCVTLRNETEWIETVEHGWNRLWTQKEYCETSEIPDYGSGRSSEIILDSIMNAVAS
jgi:UDP-GlcNAc3NAcA epimerase